MASVLPFERFSAAISHEFEIDHELVTRDATFFHDLEFDSFEFFRLMVFMEYLIPGSELPEELPLETLTVNQVYGWYVSEVTLSAMDGPAQTVDGTGDG